ncbi:hypothetical protein KQH50_00545 [bacterium]|nr:hypothetical protein [bacterium]
MKLFCLFLIWALLLSWHGSASVQAQAGPVISVSPAESEIILNHDPDSTTVQLDVTDVMNLSGFEVTISYDPEVLELVDWSYGAMLTNLFKFYEQDEPGSFTLACAQLSQPGVSGSGTILELTFQGLRPGASPLTVATAIFTDPEGTKSYPAAQNGTIGVAYDPDLLPQYHLDGEVSLQGQSQRGGVPVQLAKGEVYQIGPYTAISQDSPGVNVDFGDVVADAYVLTTSQPRYLNITADLGKILTVSESNTVFAALSLAAGNAVWMDNVIDAGDASLVGASYGRSQADLAPGETLDADVNFDGVVNLRDLALVAGNYGLTSETAYGDWQP